MPISTIRLTFCLGILCFASLSWPARSGDFKEGEVQFHKFPTWFADTPFNDLADLLNTANEDEKKGLFVLYTTQGCSYCAAFIERSLHNPELVERVQRDFESVGFEIFDDAELISPKGETLTVKDFALSEGVQFAPTILFYGPQGDQVLRLTGYQTPERFSKILSFVSGAHYQNTSFKAYMLASQESPNAGQIATSETTLLANSAYNTKADSLARTQSDAKPLLVVFERSDCAQCKVYHTEVLDKASIAPLIEQFDVAQLNTNDNSSITLPNGDSSSPQRWFNENGFTQTPALMLFDPQGNLVLKTDALVLEQRMINSLGFVLEKAYEKGWTYQQFARSKAIGRSQQ